MEEKRDDVVEQVIVPTQEQVNAMVESAKNPQNAVRMEVTNIVSNKLREDANVIKRAEETAGKVVDAGLIAVENEADKAVSNSEKDKLQAYYQEHKEELETAGIEEHTYLEDMERAVKWHRKCAKFHWVVCGWWMTLIRTFFQKAKPFKWFLNTLGFILNLALIGGVVYGVIKLIEIL